MRRERIESELGDWCLTCSDAGEERPVRFPHRVNPDGQALYRCPRCASEWTVGWAISGAHDVTPPARALAHIRDLRHQLRGD